MVLDKVTFFFFRGNVQSNILQNLQQAKAVLVKAEDEALSCREQGIELSTGILRSLNHDDALQDIKTRLHFVDEVRCATHLIIQLSDKLCKIFGKPLISNDILNALSKTSIITLIISIFLESALEKHQHEGLWENVTGQMWIQRNGYFMQLLTEFAHCESLKYKSMEEVANVERPENNN